MWYPAPRPGQEGEGEGEGEGDAGVDDAGPGCGPGERDNGSGGCELDEPDPDDADLELWLDASNAASRTLDSGNIFEWRDRRPTHDQSNQFSAPTVGERPAYVAAAWNGRGVIELEDGEYLSDAAFEGFNGASAYTIITVVSHSGAGTRAAFSFTSGSDPGVLIQYSGTSDMSLMHRWPAADQGGLAISLQNVTQGTTQIVTATRVGGGEVPGITLTSSDEDSLDGNTATESDTSTDINAVGRVTLGGLTNEGITGRIAEVLVYSRALDVGELSDVREYLNAKWGAVP